MHLDLASLYHGAVQLIPCPVSIGAICECYKTKSLHARQCKNKEACIIYDKSCKSTKQFFIFRCWSFRSVFHCWRSIAIFFFFFSNIKFTLTELSLQVFKTSKLRNFLSQKMSTEIEVLDWIWRNIETASQIQFSDSNHQCNVISLIKTLPCKSQSKDNCRTQHTRNWFQIANILAISHVTGFVVLGNKINTFWFPRQHYK